MYIKVMYHQDSRFMSTNIKGSFFRDTLYQKYYDLYPGKTWLLVTFRIDTY